jgi:hypothetical protein
LQNRSSAPNLMEDTMESSKVKHLLQRVDTKVEEQRRKGVPLMVAAAECRVWSVNP